MWQHWINLLLGLWIVLSAYLGFDANTMATNLTITGIVIAALALWGAVQHSSNVQEHRHSHA